MKLELVKRLDVIYSIHFGLKLLLETWQCGNENL